MSRAGVTMPWPSLPKARCTRGDGERRVHWYFFCYSLLPRPLSSFPFTFLSLHSFSLPLVSSLLAPSLFPSFLPSTSLPLPSPISQGHGDFQDQWYPRRIYSDEKFVKAEAGGYGHSILLSDKGEVWTFGWSEFRQLVSIYF
jgi:hypothetical protein